MAADATIRVQGLSESLKMLSKVDKNIRKEVTGVLKEATIKIKNEAFARSQSAPGVSRRGYPLTKGAYTRRASSTKASVGISGVSKRNAAVFGAEFGAKRALVPRGRTGKMKSVGQQSMRRRTFPVWRGNATTVRGSSGPGWIILPILRKRIPQMEPELEKEINALFLKSMRSSGTTRLKGVSSG